MRLHTTLLMAIVIAGSYSTSVATAVEGGTRQLDLRIEGTLLPDDQGRLILEGDLFLRGGIFDGFQIGQYVGVSIPRIDPNCDPLAAAVLGFNAADGQDVFSFGHPNCPWGTIETVNSGCIVAFDPNAFTIDVVSEGSVVGGTGLFRRVRSGRLDSSSTTSLVTGEISVDVTLTFYHGR